MLNVIDNFLNRITMYRLVLYYLLILLLAAMVFGLVGMLPYDPLSLLASAAIIFVVCLATNTLFAKVFHAQVNTESVYITALILALIISPLRVAPYSGGALPLLIWASVWAMASKYMFAIGKKHIFNPAAFAVALTALTIGQYATWWVGGNIPLLTLVLIGGVLIVRKIQRSDMVLSFLAVALVGAGLSAAAGSNILTVLTQALTRSPLLFFAFIMLTEPLTTPPTRSMRMLYGALVGALFAPAAHIGGLYFTPELALVAGNLFSYAVSPKGKYLLTLTGTVQAGEDQIDFLFTPDKPLRYRPGQYMEWTLGHAGADTRGNRRYFTLASSPGEATVHLGVKFYTPASSFKKALLTLRPGDTIVASQVAGEFVLPRKVQQKLVFIAGGIGITPFRSMVQYLLERQERRDVVLLYSNRSESEIMYREVFDRAQSLGVKTVYALTDTADPDWAGHVGRITVQTIEAAVPDYKDRIFYISGPRSMTTAFEKTLAELGVHRRNIHVDFFPGFA